MDNLNFQYNYKIPELSKDIKRKYQKKATDSKRRRYPLIIHNHGDEFNQVFNFVCIDSYMRPHLHPSDHMIEKMHLIEGSFELFFFDNSGKIVKTYLLDKPGQRVFVPALQSLRLSRLSWQGYEAAPPKRYETVDWPDNLS